MHSKLSEPVWNPDAIVLNIKQVRPAQGAHPIGLLNGVQ